jgi:hypothetical protein
MSHQPSHGSRRIGRRDLVSGTEVQFSSIEPRLGRDEPWQAGGYFRAPAQPRPAHHDMEPPGAWVPEEQSAYAGLNDGGLDRDTAARRRYGAADTPVGRDGRPASFNGDRQIGGASVVAAGGQSIVVSVPAMRTFVTLAAAVALSVVLSVIATLTVIAVMNAGVILPEYAKLNQPTQVSQLGICVNATTGKITTPTNVGFCPVGDRFVHVQPSITHP